ncbi:alpha/beta fold hydrolase [Streptomyces sp. NPDC059247]|uniref:alpha/beta fold hydrolase n=1 Tax=Streptomyces sp. NPDC059247 TaxID=3346790 RepID=UPI0036AA5986
MTPQNVTGRYFDVPSGQLYAHVRESEGIALVLFHYWGGSRRTWMPVLRPLDPALPFTAYDQRGWGDSADLPGPYGPDRLADDAQQVLSKLGHDRFVLVGHSMGGKVAQMVAARKPAGLADVVLVVPAPAAPVAVTELIQDNASHAYDSEATVAAGIDQILTHRELADKLRRQVIEDSLRVGSEARLEWPRHGMVQDVSAGVGDIDVPVLLLVGSHNKIDPLGVLSSHHLLPTIRTALDGADHLSPLEVPDQVAAHIAAFTASL